MARLPRIEATTFSFRLMEMVCHDSYPLNSENASPPGTFTLYLSPAAGASTAIPQRANPTNTLFRTLLRLMSTLLIGDVSFIPATCRLSAPQPYVRRTSQASLRRAFLGVFRARRERPPRGGVRSPGPGQRQTPSLQSRHGRAAA